MVVSLSISSCKETFCIPSPLSPTHHPANSTPSQSKMIVNVYLWKPGSIVNVRNCKPISVMHVYSYKLKFIANVCPCNLVSKVNVCPLQTKINGECISLQTGADRECLPHTKPNVCMHLQTGIGSEWFAGAYTLYPTGSCKSELIVNVCSCNRFDKECMPL